MNRDTKVRVTLYSVKRIKMLSGNQGNPRYEFHTNYGIYRTKPDTSMAYEVNYPEGVRLDVDVELTLANGNTNSVYDWKVL